MRGYDLRGIEGVESTGKARRDRVGLLFKGMRGWTKVLIEPPSTKDTHSLGVRHDRHHYWLTIEVGPRI